MKRSAAHRRSMAVNGHFPFERPRRPRKIPADVVLWKKLVTRNFSGHDWIDDSSLPTTAWHRNLQFLMCRDCGQRVANAMYWAKSFQIVISDQIVGWSPNQIMPCMEAQVFLVQNA